MTAQSQVENLLLSELRHRLANSFQLLQAVIQIRLRSAADPESRRHLAWLLDVVTALGMLQQRVGLSGPTDFGAYLIEATSYWRRVCDGRPIEIVVEVEKVQVSEVQASTLALIAHELISNAIEHAFPHGRGGVIQVGFRRGSTDNTVGGVTTTTTSNSVYGGAGLEYFFNRNVGVFGVIDILAINFDPSVTTYGFNTGRLGLEWYFNP